MRYRLRTLLIVLAVGPALLAVSYFAVNAVVELMVASALRDSYRD